MDAVWESELGLHWFYWRPFAPGEGMALGSIRIKSEDHSWVEQTEQPRAWFPPGQTVGQGDYHSRISFHSSSPRPGQKSETSRVYKQV